MNLLQKILLTLGLLTACASLAEAHAFPDHAEPAVGSTIKGSPSSVKIWFTRKLDGAHSDIEVFDAKGAEVDRKDSMLDALDKTQMSVSVPNLPPGTYKVEWSAVCLDTHHTTGNFTFEVASP
jgi:methionine-rich copper-binding protein CopC